MTGDGGVTPERLAQLVDGAAPQTEAEREAVALMAEVRGLAEPAPDAVRDRVRAIAASGAAGPRGWRRWVATAGGRRRLALAGAPVAAAVVALAVAIPAMTRDAGGAAPRSPGGVPATAESGGGGARGAGPGAVATRAAPQRAAAPRDSATGPAPPAPQASAAAPAPEAFSSASPRADGAATAPAAPAGTAMALDRAVARARSALEDAGAVSVRTREAPDGTQAVVMAEVPADAVDAATTALEKQGAEVVTQAGEAGTATVRATVTPGG